MHSTIQLTMDTMDRYSHIEPEEMAAGVERLSSGEGAKEESADSDSDEP